MKKIENRAVKSVRRVAPLFMTSMLAACIGIIGDDAGTDGPGGPDAGTQSCDGGVQVGTRGMRRLTPLQFQNTMRELLGLDDFVAGFSDRELLITETGVRQLRADAEYAITRIDAWKPGLVPCDIYGAEDDACVDGTIEALGARALRRPISEEDRVWLREVYQSARTGNDFSAGMEALIGTLLQSSSFVYLPEFGLPVDGHDAVRKLTDHEVANRLSYFLWDSMPDDALLAAAEAGELSSLEGVRAQAERMALDPRAEAKLQSVVYGWLEIDGTIIHEPIEALSRDEALYPEFDAQLVEDMKTELRAFVRRALFEDGSFEELLTSREAYVNKSLADLYGVENGPADDATWTWVTLDAERYSGLLTRAAFMTVQASRMAQSPIRRGVWVYEQAFCSELGTPPPNANDVPVDGQHDGEQLTVREEVEIITAGDGCSSCHSIINPIGYAFEHYDAIGRWQENEVSSGLPIDSAGALKGTDVDGDVADAVALSARLADSGRAKDCFAERWFVQALGAAPSKEDSCSVAQAELSFAERGDLTDLFVAIAVSDAFRYLATPD